MKANTCNPEVIYTMMIMMLIIVYIPAVQPTADWPLRSSASVLASDRTCTVLRDPAHSDEMGKNRVAPSDRLGQLQAWSL